MVQHTGQPLSRYSDSGINSSDGSNELFMVPNEPASAANPPTPRAKWSNSVRLPKTSCIRLPELVTQDGARTVKSTFYGID